MCRGKHAALYLTFLSVAQFSLPLAKFSSLMCSEADFSCYGLKVTISDPVPDSCMPQSQSIIWGTVMKSSEPYSGQTFDHGNEVILKSQMFTIHGRQEFFIYFFSISVGVSVFFTSEILEPY